MKCNILNKKNWKTSQEIFQFVLKSLSTLVYNVLKMANSYQFFNRWNESS